MALDLSTLRRPANPQVVDPSTGRMREDWQLYFDQLTTRINASVGALATDPAPADAQYIVAATNGTLSAERVATNTATVEWDFATAGQAKASVPADAFGDVVGPASATDNAVALFDGTTGKLLKNSAITVDGDGNVTIEGDNQVLKLVGPANVGIELGNVDGTGGLTYLDLHTGTTPTDYDVRLLASGGTGSDGGGTLNIAAATLQQNSVDLLKTGDATPAWTYATEVTTTGAAAFALASGLPSTVREIEIMFRGVETNTANADLVIRIGDSGGIENTGYSSICETSGAVSILTSGFAIVAANLYDAGDTVDGIIRLGCYNNDNKKWNSTGILGGRDRNTSHTSSGFKDLDAALTQVQLTTNGGGATFTVGTVSLRYR